MEIYHCEMVKMVSREEIFAVCIAALVMEGNEEKQGLRLHSEEKVDRGASLTE